MNYSDTEKLKRLTDTVNRNCRITQLYATYLERFPEAITAEMINTLTEDGFITKEEALVALLSEMFGLDMSGETEDRRLIMNYLTPSVRLLDANRYKENPYYKNVKIENATDGSWELRWESYAPYRAVIAGDMIMGEDFSEVPPLGFFTEKFDFPAVLENGNEWMTLTPVDLDTCDDAIDAAKGRVVTFGLGLGYYAYMVSEKTDVESITVVEKSGDVIRLFEKYIFPYFSHKDKVRIIQADAFEYAEHEMPMEKYDFAFIDTWRDASDGSPMYEKMRSLEYLSPETRFEYWIENFLISRLRYLKFCEISEAVEKKLATAPKSYEEILRALDFKR